MLAINIWLYEFAVFEGQNSGIVVITYGFIDDATEV